MMEVPLRHIKVCKTCYLFCSWRTASILVTFLVIFQGIATFYILKLKHILHLKWRALKLSDFWICKPCSETCSMVQTEKCKWKNIRQIHFYVNIYVNRLQSSCISVFGGVLLHVKAVSRIWQPNKNTTLGCFCGRKKSLSLRCWTLTHYWL